MGTYYFSVDDTLYLGDVRSVESSSKIGKIEDWPANEQLIAHAGSLGIAAGEFARLTGTLYAFRLPCGTFKFFHIA